MKTITGRRNQICAHLKKLGFSNSYRKQSGEFICDGIKLLEEAVKFGMTIPIVLTSSDLTIELPDHCELYHADPDIINSISPLKNSQNVLFSCEIPKNPLLPNMNGNHILLDNLQDPGNVGTIIRTANALKIKSVMLYSNTADPYNPKAIRASMGAIFRQSIIDVDLEYLVSLKKDNMRIIGAALKDDCRNFSCLTYENSIVAIGNEGSGLSHEILSICDDTIMIPIHKDSQSLNAAIAAAIIMAKISIH